VGSDVPYPVTAGGHLAGDEATVAGFRVGLGAHDGGARLVSQPLQPAYAGGKPGRAYVSPVPTVAQPSQGVALPLVIDAAPSQLLAEPLPFKGGVSSRLGVAPDVDQPGDAMLLEEGDEIGYRPCGMRRVSNR